MSRIHWSSRRWVSAVLSVMIGATLLVGAQILPAHADTNVTLPFAVNFEAQATATPAGYAKDYGQAYDINRGYGWVAQSNGAPLDLVGNGRERNVAADKRLDTFMQPQLPAASPGVHTVGAWKAAIDNGTYSVTVAVGDPSYIDSRHVVRAEGQTVVDFTPTGAQRSQTNTATVTVTDGFLNIDSVGGTNTKINYLEVTTTDPANPTISAVTPSNGATGIPQDTPVTVQLNEGVDANTVNSTSFQLLGPGNVLITGNYNTDGAFSNATFQPSAQLAAGTLYTVKVTADLKSPDGKSYQPFTSTFTTGTGNTQPPPPPGVEFEKSTFDSGNGNNGTNNTAAPTALALGPAPVTAATPAQQLWAAFATGSIRVYDLDANGMKTGTSYEVLTFKGNRVITGLRFDPTSTSSNIILWVSNSQANCDLAALHVACTDFTGSISKLTGPNPQNLTRTDVVTGLPRSVGDHMNNGIDFGPDGALYLGQGANNGYGAPDSIWGNRAEVPMSAAVLRIDVANITTFPYSVNTSTGYDPTAPGARVTRYATGVRNPYSVVWHSNGKLYSPVNESASGNTPADPAGGAPALNDLPAMNDYFTQIVPGRYYGHPNPSRGEYRLNGGNPTSGTDAFEVAQYPVGTQPNPNWRKPDLNLGVHRSANGSTEFKSDVFGSNLQGQILVTEFSGGKDILAVKLDGAGNAVSKSVIQTGFNNPLPIVANPVTGRLYVGEYGSSPFGTGGLIDILVPKIANNGPTLAKVNFETQSTVTPAGYSKDYGQAFDATRKYGWETIGTTGTPLSLVGNGRERNLAADKRRDTFMSMQLTQNATGVKTPGQWEYAVTNGMYNVTIGVGDPQYLDSQHVIRAEGTQIINFTPTNGNPTTVVSATVTVNDGRLTLDPVGGTNTKIAFVDIGLPQEADTTPPTVTVTPSGTTNASGQYQGSATVTIAATDAQSGVNASTLKYTVDGGAQQTYTAPFVINTVGNHPVVVNASDNAGNAAAPVTINVDVVAAAGPIPVAKVNFETQTTATPAGYSKDYGQAFDVGRKYGWMTTTATSTPLDLVGNGRERNVASDKRLDTFMQPQLPAASPGVHVQGKWEYLLPNGDYRITVGVGDPSYIDSRHIVRAETQSFIDFTPVTANRSLVQTRNITITDGRLTLDTIGGTNTKINYVDIDSINGTGPVEPAPPVPPVATVTVSGTTNPSGEYVGNATVTIDATDVGSGVKSVSYTLDSGAPVTYTGPFVVSTNGAHNVTATAVDYADNVSAPAQKAFTIVPPGPTPPSPLSVSTPENFLGLGNRLVYSTVKNQVRPGHNMTITNTGASSVNVTGFTFAGPQGNHFQLCAGQPTNFAINAGASAQVCVRYMPTVDAVTQGSYASEGTIRVNTNVSGVLETIVSLGGLNARNYESYNEPDLKLIAKALGYSTNIPVDNKPQILAVSPSSSAVGDEVVSAFWKKLDTSKPIGLYPVAHYSGKCSCSSPNFGWYAKGSATNNFLYNFPGGSSGTGFDGYGQNQLLMPGTSNSARTFNTNGSFGFVDSQGNKSADGAINGRWHNVRFFPAKDAAGNVIPGTFLVGDDIGGPLNNGAKNWDYQDYAFVLTNVQPDGGNDQPIPGQLAKSLEFTGSDAGLANTGFTTTKGAYDASRVSISGGRLNILTNVNSDTAHTNALQIPVNMGTDFRIQSRLVGPFDAINAGNEQQAIFFGPDQTNYLKFEVEWASTKRVLTIWKQQGGSGAIIARVDLPGNNANTLDLRMDVTPSSYNNGSGQVPPHVAVSYAVNGSATFTKVNATVNQGNVPAGNVSVPNSWITANTPAGVITSHQGTGGAQFTAVYENFNISRRY